MSLFYIQNSNFQTSVDINWFNFGRHYRVLTFVWSWLLDSQNCAVSLKDDSSEGSLHRDSIRAVRYGAHGKLLVSAGDDKVVKVWSTESWRCITTV